MVKQLQIFEFLDNSGVMLRLLTNVKRQLTFKETTRYHISSLLNVFILPTIEPFRKIRTLHEKRC